MKIFFGPENGKVENDKNTSKNYTRRTKVKNNIPYINGTANLTPGSEMRLLKIKFKKS